jgi:hypothetical protein
MFEADGAGEAALPPPANTTPAAVKMITTAHIPIFFIIELLYIKNEIAFIFPRAITPRNVSMTYN